MKTLVHLSRAYVEFGPFTRNEILDFHKRGLLKSTDYLRDDGADAWSHYEEWLAAVPAAKPAVKKARAAVKKAKPAEPAVKKAGAKK